MLQLYDKPLKGHRDWHDQMEAADPDYFARLSLGQSPQFLFIGCADSPVPAIRITGSYAAEMFVHRNIADLCVDTDLNMLSVLQNSIDVLLVKHVIICGYYGCGGVTAAMSDRSAGTINHWLNTIKNVYVANDAEIDAIVDDEACTSGLVELNVETSVVNLCKTNIIQRPRATRGGTPIVHC